MPQALTDPSFTPHTNVRGLVRSRFLLRPQLLTRLSALPTGRDIPSYTAAAALRSVFEMGDAGACARLLANPQLRPLMAKTSGAWDMTTASRSFLREVTPQLLRPLSGRA